MVVKEEADIRFGVMDRIEQKGDEDDAAYIARLDVYACWVMSGTQPEKSVDARRPASC